MSIKRVTIASDYPLEGMLQEESRRGGVVICHPHPLYGGEMHNNVVSAMDAGFSGKGFTTLRFNFRGVGGSGGKYDDGDGEVTDALAALTFLRSHLDEGAQVILAGYSFGAWIAARAASMGAPVDTLFLVSYPFVFYPANELEKFGKRIYFVGGTADDIGPVDSLLKVYKGLKQVDKNLKIIPTDHFYGGKEGEITGFIREHVDSV